MLTKAIENKLPAIGTSDELPLDDHVLVVKYFCPWSNWTWYGVEYDPEAKIFFGYVEGFENEWGDFSLAELESVTGPMGLKIERDLYFDPIRFGEAKAKRIVAG